MDIFQRTGTYHKMKDADHGIKAKQMADFGATIPYWQEMGLPTPTYKTPFEEILIGKFGTSAGIQDTWIPGSFGCEKQMVVGRYNSDTVGRLVKESKLPITEKEIISQIQLIEGDCDLRKTSATSLPNLRRVRGTLTLDTYSPLESLAGLKKVGKINVVAKDMKDMDNYLKKLGILAQDGKKLLVDVADDIYLIMKNYL